MLVLGAGQSPGCVSVWGVPARLPARLGRCRLLGRLQRQTGLPQTLDYCIDSPKPARVAVLFGKKRRGEKARHKKQESPQRLVAGITLFTPVTTDVLSRSEFELREASLKQTPCEQSSMKEQQALEGGQEYPQEHEQQLAS